MNCVRCGRPTGDRRRFVCWRCRHGLGVRIVDHEGGPLVCVCANPDVRPIGGIWAAVAALECRHCGRAVLSSTIDDPSAP